MAGLSHDSQRIQAAASDWCKSSNESAFFLPRVHVCLLQYCINGAAHLARAVLSIGEVTHGDISSCHRWGATCRNGYRVSPKVVASVAPRPLPSAGCPLPRLYLTDRPLTCTAPPLRHSSRPSAARPRDPTASAGVPSPAVKSTRPVLTQPVARSRTPPLPLPSPISHHSTPRADAIPARAYDIQSRARRVRYISVRPSCKPIGKVDLFLVPTARATGAVCCRRKRRLPVAAPAYNLRSPSRRKPPRADFL